MIVLLNCGPPREMRWSNYYQTYLLSESLKKNYLTKCFYQTGVVSLDKHSMYSFHWAGPLERKGKKELESGSIQQRARVQLDLWRTLGNNPLILFCVFPCLCACARGQHAISRNAKRQMIWRMNLFHPNKSQCISIFVCEMHCSSSCLGKLFPVQAVLCELSLGCLWPEKHSLKMVLSSCLWKFFFFPDFFKKIHWRPSRTAASSF